MSLPLPKLADEVEPAVAPAPAYPEPAAQESFATRLHAAFVEQRRRLTPEPVRRAWRLAKTSVTLARNYTADLRRYGEHSGAIRATAKATLEALITMDYHRLEKGLAMSHPRPGFGVEVATRLVDAVESFVPRFGATDPVRIAVRALDEYRRWPGTDLPEPLRERIDRLCSGAELDAASDGGTREVTRDEVHRASRLDLSDFFDNRYSVRHFEPRPVEPELIRRATRMAQKTPSVCNRQTARVYAFHDPDERRRVLALQNGNRGFTEQIGSVLVVTCDVRSLVSIGERNQGWIDGGLFAMSLVYALHSLGLGTCFLNWSVEHGRDAELRRLTGIPDHEIVVVMIAVGHLPERFRVACSPRRPLEEVLVEGRVQAAQRASR